MGNQEKMKNIFIITGGNNEIGYGHITRCLSLATMLCQHFSCSFLLIETPFGKTDMDLVNFEKYYFLDQDEILDHIRLFAAPQDIVVIDSYNISQGFLEILKSIKLLTVSINDIPEKSLPTDIVINHTINLDQSRFNLSTNTKLLLGEKYLLLRNAFLEDKIQTGKNTKKGQIFLCFGGADPYSLSLKIIQFLELLRIKVKIVVLTNSNDTKEEIISFQKHNHLDHITVYDHLCEYNVISLISESELAIVPSSTIALECMCVGINLLTGYYVDNQVTLAENISQLGLGINVKNFIKLSLQDFENYFIKAVNGNFASRQRQFFSNKSKRNILREFKKLGI